jgi:hypothetical protein
MSLLHQDSPEEIDDAARGEELTKGTSHVAWASVIAVVVVTAVVAVFLVVTRTPPAVTGEVVQVWTHPHHTETSGIDANGAPMAKDRFDQMLVIARVRLRNQSKQSLFLHEIMTNATLDDGIHTSYAAIPVDYERIFVAYPELASLHATPLSHSATIAPGETIEGDFISAFRLTEQQWNARKALNFSFGIQYQPHLVLTPQVAVTPIP